MSRKDGAGAATPLHNDDSHTQLSAATSGLSTSTSNLSDTSSAGRRPVIIRDAQQRAMLRGIRDSLAHHLKPTPLPSPGSDASGASGASGTSTPSRDTATSGRDGNAAAAAAAFLTGQRNANYNSTALAKIRKSLQMYVKEEVKEDSNTDLETAKVNVKELIQQMCPTEQKNGLNSLVSSGSVVKASNGSVRVAKTPVAVTPTMEHDSVSPPPPLPPRTRALTTPPPPLPPREVVSSNTVTGTITASDGATNANNTAVAGPSRTSVQYQPIKRSGKDTIGNSEGQPSQNSQSSAAAVAKQDTGSSNTRRAGTTTAPSATPPSSLEQLAEQTGLTTQQIQEILMQHSQKPKHTPNNVLHHPDSTDTLYCNPEVHSASQQQQIQYEQYNTAVEQNLHNLQRREQAISSPSYHPPNHIPPPPPPHYSSTHIIPAAQSSAVAPPPPPPYNHHQQSPASSVTSGSSNDYLLVGYGAGPGAGGGGMMTPGAVYMQTNGEYRTPAYGESPSSGSSSPASLHAHPPLSMYNQLHNQPAAAHNHNQTSLHPTITYTPPAATVRHNPHTHHHHLLPPTPIMAWEAKQQAVIAQSARSQLISRPQLQTATAPPINSQAPPSYTSSVHAHVAGSQRHSAYQHYNHNSPPVAVSVAPHANHPAYIGGGGGGGNVHIKLRNHQDPQLKVVGSPSFHVTAHNSQHPLSRQQPPTQQHVMRLTNSEQLPPSIQIQLSAATHHPILTNAPHDAHRQRKGSLETRSDSPVSRTTNQSPCSMISTASTSSDLIVDRPPPPYPGPAKQYNSKPTTHNPLLPQAPSTAASSEVSAPPSETDQSEADESDGGVVGGGERRTTTHRCTSPIPKLRQDSNKKHDDRGWTKLRHYAPAAFKFYMEQHIENVLKQHQERIRRRVQLEKEMSKVELSEEAREQMRSMLRQKETIYLRLKRAKMERSMFDVITKIGVGAFGEVSLVRKFRTESDDHQNLEQQLYAMKTLRKVDVIRRNQVAHVKAERDILAEADLEWVTKLYYSFQDKENLYFIMEYIPGGDLMALLIKKGIFEEPLAIFYIAELVLAIESVHKMGFIHRDIKPDNILIDRDGHIKLTDFGLCTGFRWTHNSKYYQEGNHNRQDSMDPQDLTSPTDPCQCPKELPKILEKRRRKEKQRCLAHSLVGTPNYIAPEVLMRQGYTRTCDWWSVGVILYEMLVGQPPFLANTPKETQLKVIHWKSTLYIPDESGLSAASRDIILRLCMGAEGRLGKNGAEEIKKHGFFKPIDFTDLRHQKAPYKPTIRYPTDTSNFDEVEEQHEHPAPTYQTDDLRQNGHYPEHAFSEFTFRRFFDDGGHPNPLNISESLSLLSISNNNVNNGGAVSQPSSQASGRTVGLSDDRTPQNSYHEEKEGNHSSAATAGGTPTSGNPVYV